MPINRPDDPLRSARRAEPDEEADVAPRSRTGAAAPAERGEGAHSEKIGDDANRRADDTPPGDDAADD